MTPRKAVVLLITCLLSAQAPIAQADDPPAPIKCKPIARAADSLRSQPRVLMAMDISTIGKNTPSAEPGYTIAVDDQVNVWGFAAQKSALEDRKFALGIVMLDGVATEPCSAETKVTLAGRRAVRYQYSDSGDDGEKWEMTVWLDAETQFPIKMRQSLTDKAGIALGREMLEAASGRKLPAETAKKPGPPAKLETTVTTAVYLYGNAVPPIDKANKIDPATKALVRTLMDAP